MIEIYKSFIIFKYGVPSEKTIHLIHALNDWNPFYMYTHIGMTDNVKEKATKPGRYTRWITEIRCLSTLERVNNKQTDFLLRPWGFLFSFHSLIWCSFSKTPIRIQYTYQWDNAIHEYSIIIMLRMKQEYLGTWSKQTIIFHHHWIHSYTIFQSQWQLHSLNAQLTINTWSRTKFDFISRNNYVSNKLRAFSTVF